ASFSLPTRPWRRQNGKQVYGLDGKPIGRIEEVVTGSSRHILRRSLGCFPTMMPRPSLERRE
ncbi:hypothetical protein, partial [Chryseobacterium sp. SIMBA_028]|uniref:hypothetical protein n=1 Tax=Chryseobacterium sp. SIMBA_028 TaxID=3085771 RepID=UPI00397880B6